MKYHSRFNKQVQPSVANRAGIAALVIMLFGVNAHADETVLLAGMEMPALPISILNKKVNTTLQTTTLSPGDVHALQPTVSKVNPVAGRSNPKAEAIRQEKVQGSKERKSKFAAKMSVNVIPGVNAIVKISKGYLNRIITPFEKIVVETTSDAKIKMTGSSLYISAQTAQPVTMFIHQKGRMDPAISLTLLPIAIPPRQIKLVFNDSVNITFPEAGKWEKTYPFVDGVKLAMRDIAKGNIPNGYGFRQYDWNIDPVVKCINQQNDISVTPRQVMPGHGVTYVVSKVKNISDGAIELQEKRCYRRGVLAVAFWPKDRLQAGQATEMYIAYKNLEHQQKRTRKSLLSQGYDQ